MESTTDQGTARPTTDPTDPTEAIGPAAPPFAVAPEPRPEPAPVRTTFRLRRSRTDRMLGGVCGGVAEALGVDAALVRIGLVTLTLLGFGLGALVYAAIWLVAPEADEG